MKDCDPVWTATYASRYSNQLAELYVTLILGFIKGHADICAARNTPEGRAAANELGVIVRGIQNRTFIKKCQPRGLAK